MVVACMLIALLALESSVSTLVSTTADPNVISMLTGQECHWQHMQTYRSQLIV